MTTRAPRPRLTARWIQSLLLWVQTTLIMTSVRAYHRWVAPLPRTDLDRFWQEARRVGVRMGIPLSLSPADWGALADYWRRMLRPDGPIHVTPTARRMAPLIMRPPLPMVPGFAVDLLALPGLALLPTRLRQEFGIGWDSRHDLLARGLGLGVRTWVRVLRRAGCGQCRRRARRNAGRGSPRSSWRDPGSPRPGGRRSRERLPPCRARPSCRALRPRERARRP